MKLQTTLLIVFMVLSVVQAAIITSLRQKIEALTLNPAPTYEVPDHRKGFVTLYNGTDDTLFVSVDKNLSSSVKIFPGSSWGTNLGPRKRASIRAKK